MKWRLLLLAQRPSRALWDPTEGSARRPFVRVRQVLEVRVKD